MPYSAEISRANPSCFLFLIDQSGIVRLAFVNPNYTRRLDPSFIVARLKELRGELSS